MAVDDHVTTLPEASDRGAPEAAAASRRRQWQRLETLRAFALGAGFPILLVLIWDRAVALTGTPLVPSPYQVAVMMYDFTFGSLYDDAFSGTILVHIWQSMQPAYCGFLLAARIGTPTPRMIVRIRTLTH